MFEFYFGIGYEDIEFCKYQLGQYEWNQMDQEFQDRGK